MPQDANGRKRHFFLKDLSVPETFRTPAASRGKKVVPPQDRQQHGTRLRHQIQQLGTIAESGRQAQEQAGFPDRPGIQVEFAGFPGVELAFDSLARDRQGIELSNVRQDPQTNQFRATVFVPDGKLQHFERLITDYLDEKRGAKGQSLDHRALIDTIREIRAATLDALWTDAPELFPESDDDPVWWEVWIRSGRRENEANFRERATELGFRFAEGVVQFPERTVVLAFGTAGQMKESMWVLNSVGELRRPKETAEFFESLPTEEQPEWIDDLVRRTQYPEPGSDVPHVCLLDTGVNRGHPFLEPAIAPDDLHTVEPGWGVEDSDGHGTELAGLALAGDLTDLLGGTAPVVIPHRLESVKLLRKDGDNDDDDPEFHGYRTTEAVSRPEVTAPHRARLFGLAVTAPHRRERGRPSAWSSTIDRLAAGATEADPNARLLVVSAGNVDSMEAWREYPRSNETDSVHDPGQAWNALCVGAYTEKDRITEPDAGAHVPIAPTGGLSPFSTTSLTWQAHWPLKPDILMEGGNAAKDSLGAVWMTSLSLLTTRHQPTASLLATTRATSAATALASRMASQILAAYPGLWPETVRALMVHSAEWTPAMRSLLPSSARPTKSDYERLVRICGFGAPDLDRALWSLSNSISMVVEDSLQPFEKGNGGNVTLREMRLYELPWPKEELEALGELQVELRVTLSYFIEPSPSGRGVKSRYRYESHGLRFDVMRPSETVQRFRKRINAAAQEEDDRQRSSGGDGGWTLGIQARHKGSLHSDIWRGTAADLASRGAVAVYPVTGWWKTRPFLKRFEANARYALVVSIRTPEVEVDLYGAVANRVGVPISVET